ncbi:hypothetical protein BUALT_Bualt13G0076500 [Buddleja alternifolia]|uniref:Uncharacterized protein n=1 Tax=Buddleja alternifolia TaxID=168488 RepID=A0AAV6WR13_9LAMI|nr:hypothetical protein BUALT_Bualt13G0076500 [Buddleja alternifolia]
MSALLIFTVLSILSVTRAQGLPNENPITMSPEAYAFFHPNALQPSDNNPCGSSDCSSLPLAATMLATPASTSGSRGLGAGSIAGISLVFVSACLIGMEIYYVLIKQANMRKANPEELA